MCWVHCSSTTVQLQIFDPVRDGGGDHTAVKNLKHNCSQDAEAQLQSLLPTPPPGLRRQKTSLHSTGWPLVHRKV